MAAVATVTRETREGNRNTKYGTVTVGTYATGGVALTAAQVGLNTIENIQFEVGPAGHSFSYIISTAKMLAWNGTTQAANDLDMSTSGVTRFRAQGI